MNPTINSSIATVLNQASTIKSAPKSHAFVKSNCSATEYAVFSVSIKNALDALYALGAGMHNNKVNRTNGAEDKVVDLGDVRTTAGNAVQKILDSIGNVQGHKLIKNAELINDLAKKTVDTRGALVGDALTAKSDADYYRDRIKEGGNAEYLAEMQEKLDIAKATSTLLQGKPGSRDGKPTRINDTTAFKSIERELMDIVAKQYAKTPEQVAAERAKAEADRKAKRKTAKAAKKAANA